MFLVFEQKASSHFGLLNPAPSDSAKRVNCWLPRGEQSWPNVVEMNPYP